MVEHLLGDGLSVWQAVFVLAAAFATGAFHALSGFAGGTLMSLMIAPVLGMAAVIPVLSVTQTIGATSRFWAFRRHIDWPVFVAIMAPAVPCIVVGAVIYGFLPAHAISIVLGAFLILVTLLRRPLQDRARFVGPGGLAFAGAAFGLVSGMTVGGGMLLAPFLLGRGIVHERLAAMFAAIGFSLNVTRSAAFLATASLDPRLALLGLAAGLCTVPGTLAGIALLRRFSVRIHTLWVEALVLVGGVAFLCGGLFALI